MPRTERKPLSFSTTMRNPERIVKFINCLKEFEGQLLTHDVIMKIVRNVIKEKLYKPKIVERNEALSAVYNNETSVFSDVELDYIIIHAPQKHKEAGFPEGWPSRFDTWYKLPKEFGFIYYELDHKIEISSSGHMLCDAYNSETENSGEKIQKIFLNALVKYQTKNPFRKNLNKSVPIPLLLNVLKLLKDNTRSAGISRKELPFVTCWKNNNHTELYNFIISFREKHGFDASDETVYEECLKLLESNNTIRFKFSQIMREGVDDLIRKLRITGIFSLRGMGRFIDINSLENELVNYIIGKYTEFRDYTDGYSYYKYMGSLDSVILHVNEVNIDELSYIKIQYLRKFAEKYTIEQISDELQKLQFNKKSKDEYLKLIDSPTRLEFLTSIALVKKYPAYIVKPNYAIDDEGNPTFTAKGGVADIEVYDPSLTSLVEVTLMRSRQQATNEIPAITRHLKDEKERRPCDNVFSIFVAPFLHEDTIYMCQFTMHRDKLGIYPYNISDFIIKLNSANSLNEMTYAV